MKVLIEILTTPQTACLCVQDQTAERLVSMYFQDQYL